MAERTRMPRTERGRKELLGQVIQNELARAEGGDSDELQANRAEALKYYFTEERGDELEGRSQVISADVADMTNALLSHLVVMLATDDVAQFEAEGDGDEVNAQIESDVVNRVIMEDRGYLEIQEALKDALLLKNGCLKVSVRDVQTVQKQSVEGAEPAQVAAYIQNLGDQVEVEQTEDMLTITTPDRKVEVFAVPIEAISYQAGAMGDIQELRFFAERINYTRSELVEMGLSRSMVEDLPSRSDAKTATEWRRNQSHEEYDAETRDQDLIDCHEVYLKIDLDRDGISERYKVLVADENTVLDYEPFDLIPFALGSPFINPHRLTGESLFDHMRQTQDTKTAYRRQLIDNVAIINNGRYAYDPARVSEDDVLNPTAGGGIRARDPQNSVVPMLIPDVTSGLLAAMQYEDQARSERGGAALDLMAAEAQLVGDTAQGIERQYGSKEQLTSMIARNLAETLIRDIYLLTHEFLRRFSAGPVTVKVNEQSQQVDPRQWPPRNRLNVKVGLSPGERSRLSQTLMLHMQLQAQAMSAGMAGILASPETIHRTAIDWLRMAGVDNPDRLVVDPQSPAAQQAAQAQQQAAQEQQQTQLQLMQAQQVLEKQRLEFEREKAAGELAHKYYDTDADVAVAEAKIAGEGTIELEKQRMAGDVQRETAVNGGAPGARETQ